MYVDVMYMVYVYEFIFGYVCIYVVINWLLFFFGKLYGCLWYI